MNYALFFKPNTDILKYFQEDGVLNIIFTILIQPFVCSEFIKLK